MGLALALFNLPFVHRLLQGTPDAHCVHRVHQACQTTQPAVRRTAKQSSARALRVVRVVEADSSRPHTTATRVLISGSMGQVCAELDRLAALEAAA